jgi:hypothetical protein
VVPVAARDEVARDLAGGALAVGIGDDGPLRLQAAQGHVGDLEPQVSAVIEERGDQVADEGLLRGQHPDVLLGVGVAADEDRFPVNPDLYRIVRLERAEQVAKSPLGEHPHSAVLHQAGSLPLLDVGARLPLEDDAVNPAPPQQHRGGQPGNTPAHDRDGRFLARCLRRHGAPIGVKWPLRQTGLIVPGTAGTGPSPAQGRH